MDNQVHVFKVIQVQRWIIKFIKVIQVHQGHSTYLKVFVIFDYVQWWMKIPYSMAQTEIHPDIEHFKFITE